MEDETIEKIVNNPEGAIDALKSAEDAIKSLSDANADTQNESEDISESNYDEEFDEVIDNLLERLTGYRYYDIPSNEKKRIEMGVPERYHVIDLEGDKIAENITEDEVVEYVKNLIKHDGEESSEHKEINNIEDAKSEIELHKLGKVINVKDTKQLDLFPKKGTNKLEPDYSKVISKMSPDEIKSIVNRLGTKGWMLEKSISLIKDGDQKTAYKEIRRMLDGTKMNENLVKPNNITNIVESKKNVVTKGDIIEFIKSKK